MPNGDLLLGPKNFDCAGLPPPYGKRSALAREAVVPRRFRRIDWVSRGESMPEHDVEMEWNPNKLADRRIRVFVDNFPDAMLWDSSGMPHEPEALPLSDALCADLRAWAQRYDEADRKTALIHPEMDPGFDVNAYNAEGDALCARLQAELGPDWAIEHVPLQRMVPTGQHGR